MTARPAHLSPADRATAVARLAGIEDELGLISTWLSLADEDKAAILLEDATRSVMAACWALERPVRTRPRAGWPDPLRRRTGDDYDGWKPLAWDETSRARIALACGNTANAAP